MLLFHRPHERCRAAHSFFCVDVHTGCQQQFYRIGIPVPRGPHQGGFAAVAPLLRVGTSFQQLLNHWGVTVQARHGQWSNPLAVCHIRLCARANQKIGCFEVFPVHSPVQRRRTVHLNGIHIRLLRDQGANGRRVTSHHRVCNVTSAGAMRHPRKAQQQHIPYDDARTRFSYESLFVHGFETRSDEMR